MDRKQALRSVNLRESFDDLSNGEEFLDSFFKSLSKETTISHPLCEECAKEIIDVLDSCLNNLFNEKKDSSYFMTEHRLSTLDDINQENIIEEIDSLKSHLTKLKLEIEKLENEKEKLVREETCLLEEENDIIEKEELHFKELNETERQNFEIELEYNSFKNKEYYNKSRLEILERVNILDELFHISYDGMYGTINGLKLGHASGDSINWEELNAAWGHVVLLLDTLAKSKSFDFEKYKLLPLGSYSRIEKNTSSDHASLELYGSGNAGFTKLLWARRYNSAMSGFLNCLDQFITYLQMEEPRFCVPYKIEKDTIGPEMLTIRWQFILDQNWTKACKTVLFANSEFSYFIFHLFQKFSSSPWSYSSMKYLAAYLLATLGGAEKPSSADVKKILSSVGIETEQDQLNKLISEVEGKNIDELISEGLGKLASVPSGGAAPAAASGSAAAAPAAEEKKEEEKEETEEEMGFGLFD
ncbi:Ribosomal protein L10/L12 domain-containing protein [Rozella allomycis CSF55]|uniref:Ribosomal protein L10/L12 domain-containing protein n=1 Tax=Rozella allomycis (strain CSF55) TaxID=988480 RepID=A0A075AV84_ROZAC|nr:Ribosomal protein L10/L12 domain-containing protein [Rozella allomycis CSF55]|eukprot:EPZ34226.1 Ribosomal protein L10/L12 domain-containing protein [Rozella allomycis CSF55]